MTEASDSSATRILDDPANFLHALDLDGNRAFFFRTDPQLLRDATFVDGRVPVAIAESAQAPLSPLTQVSLPAGKDRFLFNCSFCGSTFLSSLLDVPGRSLVLKEPRCLTDIAAWRIFQSRDGLPTDGLLRPFELARAALRRRFAPREAVSVKVASQGNVLLDKLAEDPARIRPVFITISRLDFLRAIFRGGADRMQYAAKIAWFMATFEPDGDRLLREAADAGADPFRKAANLAILARFLQVSAFRRAARAGGWDEAHVIDYQDIARFPRDAAMKAARALDLAVDDNDIDRNVERLASRNAKLPGQAFSHEGQRAGDRKVEAEHRQVFDHALAWAEATLGPQVEVAA